MYRVPQAPSLAAISVDECAEEVATLCASAFAVNVDTMLIREHVAPICTGRIEPSLFLAHTLARCQAMSEVLGVTLTIALRGFMHELNFEVSAVRGEPDITRSLLKELLATRAAMTRLKSLARLAR